MSLLINTRNRDNTTPIHVQNIESLKSPSSNSSLSAVEEVCTSTSTSNTTIGSSNHCLTDSSQATTPIATHTSPLKPHINLLRDDPNEFLQCIDHKPVSPPNYNEMNPNKRINFPIWEHTAPCPINELPPSYKPAVEELTIVSMKLEWLSPYDVSPLRTWKNLIMEINSTQLNFYHIDESLTSHIRNYSNDSSSSSPSKQRSTFSFGNRTTYEFNKNDQEQIAFRIKRNKKLYLSNDKLYKSYSLQFAKFGLPIDYKKKTYVLRLRCESEQFLLNFAHVDDMIMWTMYLNMGISVALDLELRALPDYRTVPRRRRRRRRHGMRRGTHRRRRTNYRNTTHRDEQSLIPDLLNLVISSNGNNNNTPSVVTRPRSSTSVSMLGNKNSTSS